MIRLMNGDRAVARLVNKQTFPMMKAYDDVEWYDLPYPLFGYKPIGTDVREVTYADFLAWAEERCFPPERMDAKELLEYLGLKEYDRYEIIKRTGAELTNVDNFWVDFGELAIDIE